MIIFISGWVLFCVAVAVLLLAALAMQYYGEFFVTRDVLVRDFTIFDLEFASTEREIENTLGGIIRLPPDESAKVIVSLKRHLYIDFLFMPAAYGAIFIACMKVAWKMPEPAASLFSLLGWLQIVAFLSDGIENFYLLVKIARANAVHQRSFITFGTYRLLEILKWGSSLLAVVCVLSAFLYFWVSGLFMGQSLKYLLIVAIELIAFVVLMNLIKGAGRRWKSTIRVT